MSVFQSKIKSALLFSFLILISGEIVKAEPQITGQLGTPSATISPDSKVLPAPAPKFGGTINPNASESKPWWAPRIVPPAGAPNILLIITDDVGFGSTSTFGGTIPTPAMERIAKSGLRYTQFHTTALCSPTRAALITGRNHHSVGSGVIAEMATGFSGYNSIIGKDAASVAEVLKQNGYSTSWFGKNHNTPTYHISTAGPFDLWPVGLGFEYFYGFMGGETNQWQPSLYRNTTAISPEMAPGWNLTTAMADEAINWMNELNAVAPDKPFLLYYAPGGTHAPHHPTPEWIEKFKGKFDHGWNKEREIVFENQKKLGVIPQNAKLTPWPEKLIPKWESLTADQKKLYARQAEVYAAYLAYTDHEIGRVIQAVEDAGKLENTLIIFISGDNGASPEGTPDGTPNELSTFNGISIPLEEQLKAYDNWGSDKTYPHFAVGWAWAFDTPYKWTKQIASHFGGTRQGMAISWPKGIKDSGGIRNQFHHIIDIMPTILEVTGIKAPDVVNGVAQKPIEGVSMAYTFKKENANVPSTHKTQYFEMFGNRALYHDGWIISTTPLGPPWDITTKETDDPSKGFKWELYDLSEDWTQCDDVSDKHPEKLKELQEIFLTEAVKYQVLPLDASKMKRMLMPRPSALAGRTEFTYLGTVAGINPGTAPSVLNKSFTIIAEVEVPKDGAEGMLAKMGGRFGGYGFYLLKGKPVFLYNFIDLERTRWEGKEVLTPGKHTLEFDFKYDGGGLGKGGLGVIRVDDKEVANHRIERTVPFLFPIDDTFDVGVSLGTPVEDKDYKAPFKFTGKINKVTVHLKPEPLHPMDQKAIEAQNKKIQSAVE